MAANAYRNVRWITRDPLRMLLNQLKMSEYFNTDENKNFQQEFKIGDTAEVRLPQRWLIRDGAAYQAQGVTNRYTTVSMDQFFGVDWEFSSAEAVLNLDDRDGARFVKSNSTMFETCMAQLANEVDRRCAQWALFNANNVVGTLGTAVTTLLPYHRARQRLAEKSCPTGMKGVMITPSMTTDIAANNLTIFNPTQEVSMQYKEGVVGMAAGATWFEENNLQQVTAGNQAGAVTVNGSGQSGSTLAITATAGDTFLRGDRFSIGAVRQVNPMSRLAQGTNQNFIVTQDLTAVGAGNAADVLQISAGNQGIVGPGDQYQNVNALPLTGATLTMWPGTTTPSNVTGALGFMLHRNAFLMVGGKLPVPNAVEIASSERDPVSGITLRFIRQYDGVVERWINRWDVLLGFGNAYPDNCACAIAGV